MNDILFKMFPFLAKHMSNRASSLLAGFGLLALLALALYMLSLLGFKESSDVFFVAFLALMAMIPISFMISWIIEIKHEWDMMVVTVIPQSGCPFPQNAINAKKAGFRFRKPTRDERTIFGLDKKEKLSVVLNKFLSITNEEIEAKRLDIKANNPSLPIEDFMKIRERKKIEKKD